MEDGKEKSSGVAYGSLYYDRGERLAKAKEQIVEVAKQEPIGWFFDILHTPNQAPTMDGLKLQIIGIIKAQHPKMPDDNIFVIASVPRKNRPRPAQATMLRLFSAAKEAMEKKK